MSKPTGETRETESVGSIFVERALATVGEPEALKRDYLNNAPFHAAITVIARMLADEERKRRDLIASLTRRPRL